MGIIKAAMSAVGGGLADQWLEVIEADNMSDETVFCAGVTVRQGDRRSSNTKGTANVINNGSIIHVGENQFMLLTDGGRVVDYSAEPGYYEVKNSSAPSMFSGSFGDALSESFDRIRFGGVTPYQQKVWFLNLQEIKNIPFGTPNPVNYFDSFYNAELFLRAYGYYSIKIVDPLKFYSEVVPKNRDRVDFKDIQETYLSEFLTALQTALNQMSVDGIRISHVTSKAMELAKYMGQVLDEDWTRERGMAIQSVGMKSLSYDEESKKLINMRNQGAMLGDAAVREGYVQGAVARGIEAAGSNPNGAGMGFMGVGMGMQSAGGFMSAASASNQAQMREQAAREQSVREQAAPQPAPASGSEWVCSCGAHCTGAFCGECGQKRPEPAQPEMWVCACGQQNKGKFCTACGQKRPQPGVCPKCGSTLEGSFAFCPHCGTKLS